MAKTKRFGNVIDGILGDSNTPATEETISLETVERKRKGRPKAEDYERRTFQVRTEQFAKLKAIANTEGVMQKDIIEIALEDIIGRYEAKHGTIDVGQTGAGKPNARDLF